MNLAARVPGGWESLLERPALFAMLAAHRQFLPGLQRPWRVLRRVASRPTEEVLALLGFEKPGEDAGLIERVVAAGSSIPRLCQLRDALNADARARLLLRDLEWISADALAVALTFPSRVTSGLLSEIYANTRSARTPTAVLLGRVEEYEERLPRLAAEFGLRESDFELNHPLGVRFSSKEELHSYAGHLTTRVRGLWLEPSVQFSLLREPPPPPIEPAWDIRPVDSAGEAFRLSNRGDGTFRRLADIRALKLYAYRLDDVTITLRYDRACERWVVHGLHRDHGLDVPAETERDVDSWLSQAQFDGVLGQV